jgi:predicted homoserine dehydrogenase-like protein
MSEQTRRDFLAATATATAAAAALAPAVHARGDDTLKVGLIGCGDRGTGAAKQALRADPKVKLVAMCDAFRDRLQASLGNLRNIKDIAGKVDVTPDRCFDGFDGY